MVEARPTNTAFALARLCADTLYAYGVEAANSCKRGLVTPALENVVEANTLLSGLGFESGGLACAHAVAQALTSVEHVEKHFMHGEMVAVGVLTMLCLENELDEAEKACKFFTAVGLPSHFGHIKLDPNKDDMTSVLDTAFGMWFLFNEPFEVTKPLLLAAMKAADNLGKTIVNAVDGCDAAFRNLH